MKLFSLFFLLFIFSTFQTFPQVTINIPADYPTIQAGIDAADSGDVVLVAEGTYYENINYNGKAIIVASHFFVDGNKSHIENTVIDGSLPTNPDFGSVVYFMSGEDSTSVLCGFTITGGTGTHTGAFWYGGGIFIAASSPLIKNNIIENNEVHGDDAVGGGAIHVLGPFNTTLVIEHNIIRNNLTQTTSTSSQCVGAINLSLVSNDLVILRNNSIYNNTLTGDYDLFGGGIMCNGYNNSSNVLYLENNKIFSNLISDSPGSSIQWGGGIYLQDIKAYVRNNIIAYNSAESGGGLYYFNNLNPPPVYPTLENNTFYGNNITGYGGAFNTNRPYDILNCVVWGNSSPQFYGAAAIIEYSIVEESYAGIGNITQDPEFLDTTDYFLLSTTSPCIDSGNPDPMYNDIEDPNNPGFALFPAQGTLRNDIGHFGGPHSNWHNVLSDTIHVPADYATIQAAIDAANNGDVVLVAEGTYYENINYRGKAITVASHFLVDGLESHIENTIIDGSQPSHLDTGSVVIFVNGEDTTSVLCGFTLTGGTGTYSSYWNDRQGGGIYLDSSGAKITNNIIKSNSVVFNGYAYGGGIMAYSFGNHNVIISDNLIDNNYLEGTDTFGGAIALWTNSYSLVSNNILSNNVHNSAYCQGGGIHMGPGNHQIINNYIFNNSALSQASSGGGAGGIYTISYASMDDKPLIANNLIIHNQGTEGGGIKVWTLTESSNKDLKRNKEEKINTIEQNAFNPIIENNSILFNSAPGFGGGIRNGNYTPTTIINNIVWGNNGYLQYDQIYGTSQTVTYCNVQGGYSGTGNIDEDPMFDDTTFYCINHYSPCVDAGNPDPMYYDVEDPLNTGYPRLPARGTLINDMGCFGGPNSLWWTWDSIVTSVEYDLTEAGVPSEFTLSQNYPNPFNPTTTIKYGITKRTFVELRIYDILGREVELLVNEEQDAGYYELDFNASKLSSGIYLYQIKAGNFIETKKMILLK